MSVIGRLDKQVDEILITPLSKSRRDEDRPAPERGPEGDSRPPTPVENADVDESAPRADELPVWLL